MRSPASSWAHGPTVYGFRETVYGFVRFLSIDRFSESIDRFSEPASEITGCRTGSWAPEMACWPTESWAAWDRLLAPGLMDQRFMDSEKRLMDSRAFFPLTVSLNPLTVSLNTDCFLDSEAPHNCRRPRHVVQIIHCLRSPPHFPCTQIDVAFRI